jgi:hypothetical protein
VNTTYRIISPGGHSISRRFATVVRRKIGTVPVTGVRQVPLLWSDSFWTTEVSKTRGNSIRHCPIHTRRRHPFLLHHEHRFGRDLEPGRQILNAIGRRGRAGGQCLDGSACRGIIFLCQRMDRKVKRIHIETNTTDEAYARVLAAQGKSLQLPKYFESNCDSSDCPCSRSLRVDTALTGIARARFADGWRLETSPSVRSWCSVASRWRRLPSEASPSAC